MSDKIKNDIEKWNKNLNKISTTIGEIKQCLTSSDLTWNQLIDDGLIDPINRMESINGKIEFLKGIRENEYHFNLHVLYDDISYYKKELKNIKNIYNEKIAPIFTDECIYNECKEIEEAVEKQLLKEIPFDEHNFDVVGEYCTEKAFDAAEYRCVFLSLMRYVSRCLWISGLAQIWEQQLIRFHNEILLQNKNFNLGFEDIKQSFKKNFYDFEEFESYNDINELRHLVNTIKHGNGPSSEKLRELCPRYFDAPDFLNKDRLHYNKTVLLEETLFITDEDFQRYHESLISFWNEMFKRNRELWEEIKELKENNKI